MRQYAKKLIAFLIAIMAASALGVAIQKFQVWPYSTLKKFQAWSIEIYEGRDAFNRGPWSIGIYEGVEPFKLSPSTDLKNPVLTAKDVTDVHARFVADPFLWKDNDKWFMFFEVLNDENNQGDIAYAESRDGRTWTYARRIIDEDFHLSYPHVFEWEGIKYIVPESGEDLSVRLYRAEKFPDKWVYVGNLLGGHKYVDPTIFRHHGKWWMFVTSGPGAGDVLNLYYSENLATGWRPHPRNPLIKRNPAIARSAGRVLQDGERLYRVTQDDRTVYGRQVFAFEITKLSELDYEERLLSEQPIVGASGNGWNAAGMHQVDLLKVGDRWVAAVDGRSQ